MVWRWSKTAASNSNADPTINWAEGQLPSSVNDSARAEMARVAEWRDDISGTLATSGSSTAYTVTSNQSFDTLAHMDGAMIAFVPHTTNGAAPTLAVDGLTAKKIRMATGKDIPDGVLIEGTPYVATYYNTAGEFVLHGLAGNPYAVPLGGILHSTVSTPPNSSFVLPYGQAISRTTYSAYFDKVGTTFGSGDGSTTFNVVDIRGRAIFGLDNMGGTAAERLTSGGSSIDGTTLGATGGSQSVNLTQANLPSVNFTVSIPAGQGSHQHVYSAGQSAANGFETGPNPHLGSVTNSNVGAATLPSMTGTAASGGSGTAIVKMPPSIILPVFLRVI